MIQINEDKLHEYIGNLNRKINTIAGQMTILNPKCPQYRMLEEEIDILQRERRVLEKIKIGKYPFVYPHVSVASNNTGSGVNDAWRRAGFMGC